MTQMSVLWSTITLLRMLLVLWALGVWWPRLMVAIPPHWSMSERTAAGSAIALASLLIFSALWWNLHFFSGGILLLTMLWPLVTRIPRAERYQLGFGLRFLAWTLDTLESWPVLAARGRSMWERTRDAWSRRTKRPVAPAVVAFLAATAGAWYWRRPLAARWLDLGISRAQYRRIGPIFTHQPLSAITLLWKAWATLAVSNPVLALHWLVPFIGVMVALAVSYSAWRFSGSGWAGLGAGVSTVVWQPPHVTLGPVLAAALSFPLAWFVSAFWTATGRDRLAYGWASGALWAAGILLSPLWVPIFAGTWLLATVTALLSGQFRREAHTGGTWALIILSGLCAALVPTALAVANGLALPWLQTVSQVSWSLPPTMGTWTVAATAAATLTALSKAIIRPEPPLSWNTALMSPLLVAGWRLAQGFGSPWAATGIDAALGLNWSLGLVALASLISTHRQQWALSTVAGFSIAAMWWGLRHAPPAPRPHSARNQMTAALVGLTRQNSPGNWLLVTSAGGRLVAPNSVILANTWVKTAPAQQLPVRGEPSHIFVAVARAPVPYTSWTILQQQQGNAALQRWIEARRRAGAPATLVWHTRLLRIYQVAGRAANGGPP